jgi:hypothetical protein
MKTKGIQNAINRLAGARKLGSRTLMTQALQEAEHIHNRALEWLAHTSAPAAGERDDRYTAVAEITAKLEAALEQARQT